MQVFDWNFTYHNKGGNDIGFMASDIDESASPYYYGFVSHDGRWMIMEKTDTTVRYLMGQADYKTATTGAWATRAALTYKYFSDLGL